MKIVALFFLFFTSSLQKTVAQQNDSLLINRLVKEIAGMQYDSESEYNFHKGMFYTYKKWAGFPQRISPDNSIFYTAIIAFTLRNLIPQLDESNKKVVEEIISNATAAYPFYQNKYGLPSYFFWQPSGNIMPNTYFVQYLTKYIATPEDIDDTVMILMTMKASDSSVKKIKLMMDSVANGQIKKVRTTYKKYKNIPAHTTYIGHKWGIDFDFSVHCNVLYFLLEKKINFNKYDSATLTLVSKMVADREYMKSPKYISPYYFSSSVLLYHLSRLMERFTIPELELYKTQLIKDAKKLLVKPKNFMEEIILRTSLLRWGVKPPLLEVDYNSFITSDQSQFIFYQAPAASQLRNPFKKMLLNFKMLNYYFYCPAYNKTLLLEYLVEKNKK